MSERDLKTVRQRYFQDGFASISGLVSSVAVTDLIDVIETIQADVQKLPADLGEKLVLERDLPPKKRGGIPSTETGDAIFILGDPPAFDRRFAKLMVSPDIIGLVRCVLWHRDIQYHFSNVTMKHRRIGSGISWHRDFPNRYMCPRASSFVRVMICLDGMDLDNGATQFMAGSHRIADGDARLANVADEVRGFRMAPESVCCPPGTLVVIHPKIILGGPPNTSDRHRRNLVVQWGHVNDSPSIAADQFESLTGFGIADIKAWLRHA